MDDAYRPRGVEHIGLSVPDIEEAIRFFEEALGCEVWYSAGPIAMPDGTWMTDNLDLHPRAAISKVAMVRCANGPSFEVFQFDAPEQVQRWPKMSDWGGTHIAFYVDDFDAALARVEAHGARILGGKKSGNGAEAGDESFFAHFLTPWGQLLEFVSYPHGRRYMDEGQAPLWRPDPLS